MDLAAASCCTIDSAICFGKCGSVLFVSVQFAFAKKGQGQTRFRKGTEISLCKFEALEGPGKKMSLPKHVLRLVGKLFD